MLHYYDGGGRAAVFGAGVAAELEEAGVMKPTAVVGNSAGLVASLSTALGIAKDNRRVFEQFVLQDTLRPERFRSSMMATMRQSFSGIVASKNQSIADIAGIQRVMEDHGFNLEKLQSSAVPCLARVWNKTLNRTELVDMRRHPQPWRAVFQSAAFEPFCSLEYPSQLVDPMIAGSLEIRTLMERMTERVLLVVNFPQPSVIGQLRRTFSTWLYGLLSFDAYLMEGLAQRDSRWSREFRELAESGRVLTVVPPEDYSVRAGTNDVPTIRRGFDTGRRVAANLIEQWDTGTLQS